MLVCSWYRTARKVIRRLKTANARHSTYVSKSSKLPILCFETSRWIVRAKAILLCRHPHTHCARRKLRSAIPSALHADLQMDIANLTSALIDPLGTPLAILFLRFAMTVVCAMTDNAYRISIDDSHAEDVAASLMWFEDVGVKQRDNGALSHFPELLKRTATASAIQHFAIVVVALSLVGGEENESEMRITAL